MEKILLNGEDWQVCEFGENKNVYSATVPGDIHNDLLNAHIIENPYYSDNSKKCTWVVEKDWKFSKTFTVDKLEDKTKLIFDGIDTISTIYLNGQEIAKTDNMFMQYRVDVSDKINMGENKIEIVIHSIRKELEKYPTENYFGCFNVPRIFIRKAQCHFSWDWAPDFPATGIWKDVYLETRRDTYINDYKIKTELDGNITFFVNLPDNSDHQKTRKIVIEIEGKKYEYVTNNLKNFFTVKIDNPKLWWPRFLGEQNLYDFNIKLIADEQICDEKSGKFGIRTIRLEEKPKQNPNGFTCQLYVNEKPVFLKGANWVPLDVMTGRITDNQYKKAIKLAYEANFSMLRVWGGGIYENDIFYELCDELGILVWQDFAYACADIPDNKFDFINKAIAEAEYQVYRLRNHPSLAIYCGGNEKTGSHGLSKKYGDKLIYYYIRGLVEHLDGTRPYFPSSPWGYGDIGNTKSSGDCHCNSYQTAMISPENPNGVGIENFRDALKTFDTSLVSEIAVQGAPLLSSLEKYIPKDKLWPINDIYNLHFMRNPYDGTGKYFPQIQLEMAEKMFGKIESVEEFCKKSSTFHSELLRADLEYHKANIKRCSGTMPWMFNDIWPCGTWSVVDYYLTPMPAYYSMKRAFTPQNLIITKTMKGFELFIVNETDAEFGYNISAGVCDMFGNSESGEQTFSGKISPYSAVSLYTFQEYIPDSNLMYAKGLIGEKEYQTSMFKELWKDIVWAEPNLSIKYKKLESGIEVTIAAEAYARRVEILLPESEDVIFEDNYFDILPNSKKKVLIKGNNIDMSKISISHWISE